MDFTVTIIPKDKISINKLPNHPSKSHARILWIISHNPNIGRTSLKRKCQGIKSPELQQIIDDLRNDGLLLEEIIQGPGRPSTDYVITDKAISLFNSQ